VRLFSPSSPSVPFLSEGSLFIDNTLVFGSVFVPDMIDGTQLDSVDRLAILTLTGVELFNRDGAAYIGEGSVPVPGVSPASRIAGDGDIVVVGRPDDDTFCGTGLGSARICQVGAAGVEPVCVDVCPVVARFGIARVGEAPPPRQAFGRAVAAGGDFVAVADRLQVSLFRVRREPLVVDAVRSELGLREREVVDVALSVDTDATHLAWSTTEATSSNACTTDAECTIAGERCVVDVCRGLFGDVLIAEIP
jgi:hypothetical protein